MELLWKISVLFATFNTIPSAVADDCQPWTWNSKRDSTPGQVNCRYTLTSPEQVNYYTCTELANEWDISIDKFFTLNPGLDRECKTVKPNTEYCVSGFIEKPLATDGKCGPKNNNATCSGTAKQCCNSETWTCGDTAKDCAPGTCYEGTCAGANEYAIDGKCGWQHNYLKCGGKWGLCCNNDGKCGSGSDFCGIGKCQSGNCTTPTVVQPPSESPWLDGNSTDGTCGGSKNFVCNPVFGYCCGSDGTCGSGKAKCGSGCQPKYGKCG